jgi:hypothetical protein
MRMPHLSPEALARLRQHVRLFTHDKAGQRFIGLRAATELLEQHGFGWADMLTAAFGDGALEPDVAAERQR